MENPTKEFVEPPEKQMPILFPMVSIACASSSQTPTQPRTAMSGAAGRYLRGQKEPTNQNPSIGRILRNKTKTIFFEPSGSPKKANLPTAAVGVDHQSMAMGVKRGRGRPRKNTQALTTEKTSQLQLLPRDFEIKEEEMAADAHAAEASSDPDSESSNTQGKFDEAEKSSTTLAMAGPMNPPIQMNFSTQLESQNHGINQNTTAYEYPMDISDWTIADVERFFRNRGFVRESHMFREEKIDGLALSLMSRENIFKHMGLKLGPALRIYKIICDLQSRIPE